MANILSFSDWEKSGANSLFEQIVTTYDSTYDYKKDGDKYYSKKKNTTDWIEATGKAKVAIASKVFKDKQTVTKPVTKQVTKPKSNVLPEVTIKSSPSFKTKEEGDAFRLWVNKTYPVWAKTNQLDPSGSHTNSYIKKAYAKFGKAYVESKKKPKEVKKEDYEEGFFMKTIRKVFPNIVQYFNKKSLTNEDFTESHLKVIKETIKNAIDRTNKSKYGATEYIDYGQKFDQVLNARGRKFMDFIKLYWSNKAAFDVATVLGRFTYKKNQDGTYKVTDKYDFSNQYDISKEDLDWDNSNWLNKVIKAKELKPEIGLYGAIRHVAHLDQPSHIDSDPPKIELNIDLA